MRVTLKVALAAASAFVCGYLFGAERRGLVEVSVRHPNGVSEWGVVNTPVAVEMLEYYDPWTRFYKVAKS